MGRTSKREKPVFAKNVVTRRKILGWSGLVLSEKAEIPYPTLRDIEAGINAGREETKNAIAKALGCSLAELYAEETQRQGPDPALLRASLQRLSESPRAASIEDLTLLLEQLRHVGPAQRATGLALIAGDYEVARPYVGEAGRSLLTLLKAL